ncbi:hypothetical protein Rhein_2369, partial [Rheinheimera sp. A13L]|uniref:hypothetical protein n=1 Tax=Rheinheimera sp. A13L TaxID=506534 RepID=UPI0002125013
FLKFGLLVEYLCRAQDKASPLGVSHSAKKVSCMYYKRLNLVLFNMPIIYSVALSTKGDFVSLFILLSLSVIVVNSYNPFQFLIKADRLFIFKYFFPAFGGCVVFFMLDYLDLDPDWSLLYFFSFVIFYLKFLMRNSNMMLSLATK